MKNVYEYVSIKKTYNLWIQKVYYFEITNRKLGNNSKAKAWYERMKHALTANFVHQVNKTMGFYSINQFVYWYGVYV